MPEGHNPHTPPKSGSLGHRREAAFGLCVQPRRPHSHPHGRPERKRAMPRGVPAAVAGQVNVAARGGGAQRRHGGLEAREAQAEGAAPP